MTGCQQKTSIENSAYAIPKNVEDIAAALGQPHHNTFVTHDSYSAKIAPKKYNCNSDVRFVLNATLRKNSRCDAYNGKTISKPHESTYHACDEPAKTSAQSTERAPTSRKGIILDIFISKNYSPALVLNLFRKPFIKEKIEYLSIMKNVFDESKREDVFHGDFKTIGLEEVIVYMTPKDFLKETVKIHKSHEELNYSKVLKYFYKMIKGELFTPPFLVLETETKQYVKYNGRHRVTAARLLRRTIPVIVYKTNELTDCGFL